MTPPPPTIEEQAEEALDNMGMTADPTDDRQIPGVHRQITGVDNTPLRVTPDTEHDAHVVRGITSPRLICPPVQVEDVESDDEDEEEDAAPQINAGSEVEQDESGTDAPPIGPRSASANPARLL